LDPKQLQDLAMTISSLRMPATDVYDALATLDDFALNED